MFKKLIFLILAACFFNGCGDSNDLTGVTGQQGFTANNFVGQFAGAGNVTTNQASTLNLTVANNGTATGTIVVAAVNPQTAATVGTYNVSGTANLSTGTFSVSGTIPPLGTFTIVGTLPNGSNTGSYTLTLNGQTFNGTIQASSQGAPNNPGGGNNADDRPISGGSLTNVDFAGDPDYNGTNPPIATDATISGALATGQNGEATLSLILSETNILAQGVSVKTFALTVVDPSGDPIEAGDVFNLATDTASPGAVAAVSTSVGTDVQSGWSLGEFTSATVTIVSLDANSITVDFSFDNLAPNPEVANNPSMGLFDFSGRIVGNFVSVP